MDLAYCFLKWSPVGIYSSLIFLEYAEDYLEYIEDRHWRYSLFDRNRSECQKLFKILDMEYKPLPIREQQPSGRESKNSFQNNKSSKERYAARPKPTDWQQYLNLGHTLTYFSFYEKTVSQIRSHVDLFIFLWTVEHRKRRASH